MRALVTGGSSGLGAALAAALVARGDSVLVCDVNEPPPAPDGLAGAVVSELREPPTTHGEDTRSLVPRSPAMPGPQPPRGPSAGRPAVATASDSATFLRLDVRSDEDWAQALGWVEEQWGGLDLLVNNAGVAGGGRVDVATMEEWRWITEINLFGVVRGTRTFVPMLKRQGSGQIVNVASLAGLVHPAGMGSYNAVKAGVVAFSETIGHELHGYGVRTAVVCPSYFRSNLMGSMQGADTALGAVTASLVDNAPATAGDIAAAVLAGLEAGDEVILPDDAARRAWGLKQHDRATYDAVMRDQAAKLVSSSERSAAT